MSRSRGLMESSLFQIDSSDRLTNTHGASDRWLASMGPTSKLGLETPSDKREPTSLWLMSVNFALANATSRLALALRIRMQVLMLALSKIIYQSKSTISL